MQEIILYSIKIVKRQLILNQMENVYFIMIQVITQGGYRVINAKNDVERFI